MLVLCANLVYLSFDRTGSQSIGGDLYERYLKKREKEKKKKKKIVEIPVSPGSV